MSFKPYNDANDMIDLRYINPMTTPQTKEEEPKKKEPKKKDCEFESFWDCHSGN